MSEPKKKLKTLLVHIILLPTLLYTFYFLTLAPKSWIGVDEEVVEKIAKEHGREARKPLFDPGQGDLLLFIFLVAGVAGGFGAGYWWRMLTEGKSKSPHE